MSQRTIVEINHDLAYLTPDEVQLFADKFAVAIASGSPDAWKPLARYGFKRIAQCHHSDKRSATVNGLTFPIP